MYSLYSNGYNPEGDDEVEFNLNEFLAFNLNEPTPRDDNDPLSKINLENYVKFDETKADSTILNKMQSTEKLNTLEGLNALNSKIELADIDISNRNIAGSSKQLGYKKQNRSSSFNNLDNFIDKKEGEEDKKKSTRASSSKNIVSKDNKKNLVSSKFKK